MPSWRRKPTADLSSVQPFHRQRQTSPSRRPSAAASDFEMPLHYTIRLLSVPKYLNRYGQSGWATYTGYMALVMYATHLSSNAQSSQKTCSTASGQMSPVKHNCFLFLPKIVRCLLLGQVMLNWCVPLAVRKTQVVFVDLMSRAQVGSRRPDPRALSSKARARSAGVCVFVPFSKPLLY